ncbi:MAG: hypothetical protein LBF00_04250 [Mycoplasmataceae bacterium]|nr:hypothetical protein [Mycoplasmataceae bacterium]
MEQNNIHNPNRFYILSALWTGTLSFLALIIGIIIGLSIYRFDVIYAFAITLIFPTIVVFVSQKITNGILTFAKGGAKGKQIIWIAVFLFIFKYLILMIPLIIGLLINAITKTTIFNPFALVVGVLIYPLTTLIVQWYFIRDNKKKQ